MLRLVRDTVLYPIKYTRLVIETLGQSEVPFCAGARTLEFMQLYLVWIVPLLGELIHL
jgi:hypothetical protein